jgi:hypothetical protein
MMVRISFNGSHMDGKCTKFIRLLTRSHRVMISSRSSGMHDARRDLTFCRATPSTSSASPGPDPSLYKATSASVKSPALFLLCVKTLSQRRLGQRREWLSILRINYSGLKVNHCNGVLPVLKKLTGAAVSMRFLTRSEKGAATQHRLMTYP